MPIPDPTTPPPLDAYWRERLKATWMDLYSAAYFLYGSSAAEEVKDAEIDFYENYSPDQERSIEGGW